MPRPWYLGICLYKNWNSLTWVVVLTVCFTYPVLYRVSAESRGRNGGDVLTVRKFTRSADDVLAFEQLMIEGAATSQTSGQ